MKVQFKAPFIYACTISVAGCGFLFGLGDLGRRKFSTLFSENFVQDSDLSGRSSGF